MKLTNQELMLMLIVANRKKFCPLAARIIKNLSEMD